MKHLLTISILMAMLAPLPARCWNGTATRYEVALVNGKRTVITKTAPANLPERAKIFNCK